MAMAKMTLEEVREAVKELTPEERELLFLDLSEEVEKTDPEIEKAWIAEAEKRAQAILDGKAKLLEGDVVMAKARAMVHERL
ncbi:MAG: addiction module protein [Leptonema illini]|uniref:Addiction module protein n=1 Tax=Leptonema illini TaxID=183 RepID=A0A833GZ89_9LEPT|nr:MAG: addiction module protein [Leptonema illini]